MKRRSRTQNRRKLSAEDRANFARDRQALVATLITQEGFEGALVIEHIRGSQYLVRLADGVQVYMSHKKPKYQKSAGVFLTEGGWSLWETRQ